MSTTTMTDLHPIFAACCRESPALAMDKPFVIGRHVYATDGVICVRSTTMALPSPVENRPFPPADRLDWPAPEHARQWWDLPDVPDARVPCESCDGTGKWETHVMPVECDDCDGTGLVPDFSGEKVGPLILAKKYIALLLAHGVVHVAEVCVAGKNPRGQKVTRLTAAYFTGDDFDGLLMSKEK